jgi:cytochrome c oxidase cbb3-type subunit 4
METVVYDSLRHFADSWGLLYMMAIFLAVLFLVLRPGARAHAQAAARIPLEDAEPLDRSDRK